MKTMKSLSLLLILALSAGFLSSCDNDDDNEGNGTLTYKGSNVTSFKMYVGSPSGGIEVNTTGIDPKKYWGSTITEDEDFYSDYKIEFQDNQSVNLPYRESSKVFNYKFENSGMFLYDSEDDEWVIFGFGSKSQISIVSGLYKHTSGNGWGRGYHDDNVDLNYVLEQSRINSLSNMTNITDTLMYCNIHYLFQ